MIILFLRVKFSKFVNDYTWDNALFHYQDICIIIFTLFPNLKRYNSKKWFWRCLWMHIKNGVHTWLYKYTLYHFHKYLRVYLFVCLELFLEVEGRTSFFKHFLLGHMLGSIEFWITSWLRGTVVLNFFNCYNWMKKLMGKTLPRYLRAARSPIFVGTLTPLILLLN